MHGSVLGFWVGGRFVISTRAPLELVSSSLAVQPQKCGLQPAAAPPDTKHMWMTRGFQADHVLLRSRRHSADSTPWVASIAPVSTACRGPWFGSGPFLYLPPQWNLPLPAGTPPFFIQHACEWWRQPNEIACCTTLCKRHGAAVLTALPHGGRTRQQRSLLQRQPASPGTQTKHTTLAVCMSW